MTVSCGLIAAIGVFDGVHLGHRCLINQLKSEASRLGLKPAVVTFDRHPLSLIRPDITPRPLMPLSDRLYALRQCGVEVICLEFTPELRSLSAAAFMALLSRKYNIKAIVMGYNHNFGSDKLRDLTQYRQAAEPYNILVIKARELDSNMNISSTAIRKQIDVGNIELANKMLGRPYRLSGRVVHGQAIGRKIGFPTANIEPVDTQQLLPDQGAYAVDVTLADAQKHRGVLNIGYRPTVDRSAEPRLSVEVHIINWHGDLYGHTVNIDFLTKLRDEMKFPSIDSLRAQLLADTQSALKI